MPIYIDPFVAPVRDNTVAQVLLFAVFLGIVIDVVLGITGAALNRDVKSAKMRQGLQHKLGECGLLVAADLIDGIIEGGFDLGVAPVLISTAAFIALMEIFSIMENCIKLSPEFVNVPLVGQLAQVLHEAKGGSIEPQPKAGGSDE